MVGMGETYLAAFALALGLGEIASGLVATLPLLAGGILQLLTPSGVRWCGSRRRWVVLCAATQAATFLPLIVLAIIGRAPEWLVFVIAALYWGAGMAAGPAWNTWVGRIVPRTLRSSYFAQRTRAIQFGIVLGIVAAGSLLEWQRRTGAVLLGFAAIFAAAGIARTVSARLLSVVSEADPPRGERIVGVLDILRRMRRGEDARLLLFLAAMTTSVTIASPFFTPFMLGQLDFSYAQYMLLIGAAYISKVVVLTWLGRAAQRLGPRRLLKLATIGIIPISSLWLISTNYWFLFSIQFFSGTMWAAYELASFLMILETIREEERTSLLTTYNLMNTAATAVGSIAGGFLLDGVGTVARSGRLGWLGVDPGSSGIGHVGYLGVFAASSLFRGATALLLLGIHRDPVNWLRVTFRTISVRPSSGGETRP